MLKKLSLGAVAALAASLSLTAQCYEPNTGTSLGNGDDTVFGGQPLGFAFSFGGVTYTDVHVCTNGFVYLSNAGVPAPGTADYTPTTAELVAGSPKICAMWDDLNLTAANSGTVLYNALPGKAVITWQNAINYGTTGPIFSFQMQLLASGEIFVAYNGSVATFAGSDCFCAMSEGNGAVLPAASDFSVVGTSTTTTNYQVFNTNAVQFDLAGQTVQFVPSGLGYTWIPQACGGSNLSYGNGCYATSNSIYQLTVAPAASSAALTGTAISFFPTGTGYVVANAGTFIPPTPAATALALTDDSSVISPTLTTPFPYVGGTATAFSVCSNGHVAVAAGNSNAYGPVVATMLANPQTAWYSWHDYNPAAVGSGQVKFEEIGNLVTITWDGVYNFSGTTAADANTMQFQFDTATGTVVIAWQTISTNAHTLVAGEPHLVGYSPGGASNDVGSVTFATSLPATVGALQMVAMSQTATPPPVSTPTTGTVVTYTANNIPEFAPTSGLYVAIHITSLGQVPAPGLDLGFIGAPGCAALVASLDVTQAMIGAANSQSVTFAVPPGVPGLTFFTQIAALVVPNSLPNGQNAFGLTTSNAIASTVGAW